MKLPRATHRHQLVADSLRLKKPANPSAEQFVLLLRQILGRSTRASRFRIFENKGIGTVYP